MNNLTNEFPAFIGTEAEPPIVARDAVNEAMIRAWCDAVGDANPIYTDPKAAQASAHGGIVAPPTMLQAWFFPAVGVNRFSTDTQIGRLVTLFREHGFTSVVATDVEQSYIRYCRVGDVLTLQSTISAISQEKATGLGRGFFVDTEHTISSDKGDVVATMSYRRLYFEPAAREKGQS